MNDSNTAIKVIQNLIGICMIVLAIPTLAQQKPTSEKKPVQLPVITTLPASYAKRSLDEIENPYHLEEGSNTRTEYSMLARDTGYFEIGNYRIRVSAFTKMEHQELAGKIKFPDSLIYVAMVSTQNDESRDTIILKGIKPSPTLITRLQQKPADIDPYAWQQLNQTMGFGNDCPPGNCRHHFIAITRTKQLIRVTEPQEIIKILPRISNVTDAVFAIIKRTHIPTVKTAAIKGGYLVVVNEKIGDCPIDYADVLYKISTAGKQERLGMVITKRTTLCH